MEVQIRGMADGAVPAEGFHEELVNVRRDPEGFWRELEGVLWVVGLGDEPVLGLVDYTRRGHQRWLVYERGDGDESVVGYVDWRTMAGVEITRRPRASAADGGSSFLSVAGWLYIFTANADPVRWDGERVVTVGWPSAVPAPSAAGSDQGFDAYEQAGASYGSAIGTTGRRAPQRHHAARRGHVPGRGRDAVAARLRGDVPERPRDGVPPSGVSWASGINGIEDNQGRRMVRVEVPAGPDHAIATRLWATPDVSGLNVELVQPVLLLVHEAPHAAGFTFIDHTPDTELGIELLQDALGAPPSGAYAPAFHAGRLWCASGIDPTRLHYSELGLFEQFGPDAFYQIGTSATGSIVAVVPYQRGLYVLKERGIYIVRDNEVRSISTQHGIRSPQAVVSTPLGVAFLDEDVGPCVIVGSTDDDKPTVVEQLPGIRKTWRRYCSREQYSARVLYDPEYAEIWWHVCEGGSARPTLGLVLHLPTGGWSLRPDWAVDAMARVGQRVVVGTEDPDLGTPCGIGILTRAVRTRPDSAGNVTAKVTTAWSEFVGRVTVKGLELVVEATGKDELDVYTRADRKAARVHRTERGRQQAHTDHRPALWGDRWATTTEWVDLDPARVTVDFDHTTPFSFQVAIEAERIRLYALRLVLDPEPGAPANRRRARPRESPVRLYALDALTDAHDYLAPHALNAEAAQVVTRSNRLDRWALAARLPHSKIATDAFGRVRYRAPQHDADDGHCRGRGGFTHHDPRAGRGGRGVGGDVRHARRLPRGVRPSGHERAESAYRARRAGDRDRLRGVDVAPGGHGERAARRRGADHHVPPLRARRGARDGARPGRCRRVRGGAARGDRGRRRGCRSRDGHVPRSSAPDRRGVPMNWRPIRPRDPLDRPALEQLFTDFEAYLPASEHLLPESIDRTVITTRPTWERLALASDFNRQAATLATAASATQLTHNAVALRATLGAPLSVTAQQAIRARAHVVFTTDDGAGGFGVDGELALEWWARIGGVTAKVAGTRQTVKRNPTNSIQGQGHAVFAVEAWIPGAVSIEWVEVRYLYTPTAAANCHIHRSVVWVNRHNLYEAM